MMRFYFISAVILLLEWSSTVNGGRLVSFTLSQSMKNAIVTKHNQLRKTVNPPASNMKSMSWHSGLGRFAQKHADTCNYGHTTNQERTDLEGFWYVGENIAAGWRSDLTAQTVKDRTKVNQFITDSLMGWWNEYKYYDYSPNNCRPNKKGQKMCGHYTQMAWADSTKVGCGMSFCQNLMNLGMNGYYFVCNYGPGGNINNARPYK